MSKKNIIIIIKISLFIIAGYIFTETIYKTFFQEKKQLCIESEYLMSFKDIQLRNNLGLPVINFNEYEYLEMETDGNTKRTYVAKNKSENTLNKITFLCFSESEEDIYHLDGNKILQVDFYFKNNKARFGLYENNKFVKYIAMEDALSLLKENGFMKNFNHDSFYSFSIK